MDNLIDYIGFERDIKNGFSLLIEDFDLDLSIKRIGLYVIKGEKCVLKFTFDRGDVFCELKKPTDDINILGYGVFEVQKFLDPSVKINRHYDPKLQIVEYAQVIRENMKNILGGDFSWLDDFLKAEFEFNKLVKFVSNHLDYFHPINTKMRNGDVSWKQDLKTYIKKNNIEL